MKLRAFVPSWPAFVPSWPGVVLSCLALLLQAGGGASELVEGQDPQQPLFRSGTELVQVDAIVQSRDGKFVPGLAADDFEVLEDGKPQAIQLFYLVTGPSSVVPRAKVPDGTLRAPDQTARRMFTIVFDTDHLNYDPFVRVQRAAIGFLEEHFRPGDIGGVMVRGSMVNNRLTTIREELIQAVRAATPDSQVRDRMDVLREWPRLESEFEAQRIDTGDARALQDAVDRNCQERPAECQLAIQVDRVENQLQWNATRFLDEARTAANRIIDALSAVVAGLGRLEGRKTVVLLTEGFMVENTYGVLNQIAARAARFGITIYAIDARGVNRALAGSTDASDIAPHLLHSSVFDSYDDGPHVLSTETGGFVVRNSNDFTAAFSRIADDTSTYYVIGYSPQNTTLDGKFRKIEVRVKWKGMSVRARQGYLATPLPPPARMRRAAGPPAAVPPAAEAPPAGASAAAAPPGSVAPAPRAEAPPTAAGAPTLVEGREFDLISAMVARPEPDTRVRELLALDPKANPSVDVAGTGTRPEPSAPSSPAERGWDRFQRGDLDGAVRELTQAAAGPDAAAWVYYALGLAHSGLSHHREAAAALEKARERAPDFEPAGFDLADTYLRIGEPKKAVAVLQDVTERSPRDTDAWNALGLALEHQGDLDAAVAAFQKAAGIDPRESLAFYNLGRAYEQRYLNSKHWDASRKVTVASEDDRAAAKANYEKYLALGGPFEAEARAALTTLELIK